MEFSTREWAMRTAAFQFVQRVQQLRGHLPATDLERGFEFDGERIPLITRPRGIFKPRSMAGLLSLKTVFPRGNARVWYDDQREVHRQIYEGAETLNYSFTGENPDARDNQLLREAMERRLALIYFLGISPGRYQALMPAFVIAWDANRTRVQLAFGDVLSGAYAEPPNDDIERRYAFRITKQRLHQGVFREAVISAYGGKCALSGMPEHRLLDAAHIVADANELLGHPIVSNGIPLSKIHHAAFDADLLGIDPDYRVHVSDRLLVQHDGPILEAIKGLKNSHLRLPLRLADRPNRDRLAHRFAQFQAAA